MRVQNDQQTTERAIALCKKLSEVVFREVPEAKDGSEDIVVLTALVHLVARAAVKQRLDRGIPLHVVVKNFTDNLRRVYPTDMAGVCRELGIQNPLKVS